MKIYTIKYLESFTQMEHQVTAEGIREAINKFEKWYYNDPNFHEEKDVVNKIVNIDFYGLVIKTSYTGVVKQ